MSNPVDQLHACLKRETALVDEFITALQAEAHVLTEGGDDKALGTSTAAKNTYAEQLAAVGAERQTLLKQLGHSDDKAGLEAAAEQHPGLQSLCRELLSKARQASELNASNGVIIDTFLTHNQQALDTLRTLAGIGNLYDASGRTKPGSKGQTRDIKAG